MKTSIHHWVKTRIEAFKATPALQKWQFVITLVIGIFILHTFFSMMGLYHIKRLVTDTITQHERDIDAQSARIDTMRGELTESVHEQQKEIRDTINSIQQDARATMKRLDKHQQMLEAQDAKKLKTAKPYHSGDAINEELACPSEKTSPLQHLMP